MESEPLMALSSVRAGQKVKIVLINAGRGLNSRLASMGLLPNTQVTVVRNGRPGPLVVSVRDSKMMLGRGMADKIMVL